MESNLFSNLDGLSVAYVNHEGVELPLKNFEDFNEAIRSAKWRGKNRLDLIFYDQKLSANEATALNNSKFTIIGRFSKNQKIPVPDKDLASNNIFQCLEGSFPEWFKQYMKKFKKEILKDLRTVVREMVQEEFERRQKLDEAKLFKPLSHKNEFSSPMKFKKKKKISDKDSFDLLEKGDTKLLKKIEKLHSSKFDRMITHLEKLVNRTRAFLNEKRKLLERIRQIKLREAKKTLEHENKYLKNKKSAVFHEEQAFLILEPEAEFSVTVNILNNGAVPWVSPRMECINPLKVCLEKPIIDLPRLEPGQNVSATLRGKVSKRLGNYYFAYKLFDGVEEFGPWFWCFPIVQSSYSKEEIISNSEYLKPEKIVNPKGGLVDTLISSEKDMILNSQKKIEENIIEIERRLQDINVLRFCKSGDERREASLNNNPEDFEITGCNLLQDEKKKCLIEESEEKVIFGVDPLQQQEKTEKPKQMDANVKYKNFQTNKYEKDGDSDSELSVIFTSEEDENFILVPLFSESLNSQTVNSSAKPSKFDLNKESNEADQKPEKEESCPTEIELEEFGSKESSVSESCLCSRLVTEEERCSKKAEPSVQSFFAYAKAASRGVNSNDSTEENVPGKVSFKEGNCTRENSAFNTTSKDKPVSHSAEEISLSRNTKSGDKTNYVLNAFDYVFNIVPSELQNIFIPLRDKKTNNIAKKDHRINIPTTDYLGRPIYAVRKDGYCLPVKDLIQNKAGVLDDGRAESKKETQNGGKEETNLNCKVHVKGPKVTLCSNVPLNSASKITNVTSLDFGTVKFVDNNLQSALNPEVEINIKRSGIKKRECFTEDPDNLSHNLCPREAEERQYAKKLEKQEKFINAMLTLNEMGFINNDLNFRLLKKYDNDLINVVHEIVDKPTMETQQDTE